MLRSGEERALAGMRDWRTDHQHVGGDVVEAGAGGGEANGKGEVIDCISRIEIGRNNRAEAKGLGVEVTGEAAVAELASGVGFAKEVTAVGHEVALKEGGDSVVVAGVDGGVAEYDDYLDDGDGEERQR